MCFRTSLRICSWRHTTTGCCTCQAIPGILHALAPALKSGGGAVGFLGAMGHTAAGLAAADSSGPERTTAPDRSRGLRVSVGFWCHGPSPPSPSQLGRSRSVVGIPTLSRVGGIERIRGRITVEAVRARCVVTVPATSEVPQCGNSVTALGTGLKIFHVHLPLW